MCHRYYLVINSLKSCMSIWLQQLFFLQSSLVSHYDIEAPLLQDKNVNLKLLDQEYMNHYSLVEHLPRGLWKIFWLLVLAITPKLVFQFLIFGMCCVDWLFGFRNKPITLVKDNKWYKCMFYFQHGKGKLAVLGSVHMFSDQYIDKEENSKLLVRNLLYICLLYC